MKKIIKAGAVDQTIDLFIQDSASTTGGGKTGLAYNTASLTCYYRKGATGAATALALATQTVGGAHSDGGFVEIDATNMPGMYRLDLSDTIVATAGSVSLMLKGAANMAPVAAEFQVIADDFEAGVFATAAGLTASERNIRQMIESQRGHHMACGSIFYVQKGGSDSNPGTYALPFLTIQAALNACTANAHDTVVVLGKTGNSPSSFSEAITMTKAYVFLRGMGRDTQVTTAGAASSTISISANGCEVSGLWINNTGTGATKGIEVASGADFAWAHHCFIDGAKTGVYITAGANAIIENNRINDCTTTGVNVAQGAAVGLHASILSNHIDGSTTGINFAGSDASESVARYNNISGCTTGVVIAAGATKVQVTDNRFTGNTTHYTDAGTDSLTQWNFLSTTQAGAISALATDAVNSAALAASAVTEIQAGLSTLDAAGVRTAVGLAAANLDTQLGTLATASALSTVAGYIDTEVAAIKAKTDLLPANPAATGDAMTLTAAYDFAKGTVAMAESYRADGATATPAQALYEVIAHLGESSIAGTTKTIKKVDGVTTAATFTLDDGTTPTSITRAT